MKIRILSIMMALTMVLSAFLTGCGKEEGYAYEKYDSIGTMDGESIDFRFVYFTLQDLIVRVSSSQTSFLCRRQCRDRLRASRQRFQ